MWCSPLLGAPKPDWKVGLAQVNITPFVARQKVTRLVVMEISTQLLGDTPELVVGERLCWLVPVLTILISGACRAAAAWRAGGPARTTARAQAADATRVGPPPYG